MKYELTISGSFENRVVLDAGYEDATETAERLVEVMKAVLRQDGFEEIDVRYQIDDVSGEKS